MSQSIKAIEKTSIHQITSGQVVIDLQTAVKELLENSMDAGANNIEIRFKQNGLKSIEVVDNGCGIAEQDHDNIALKHHTSKLENYSDLISMTTFGFRGEALSSLCALSEQVSVTTATSSTTPMGACLVMNSKGEVTKKSTVARKQGTTVTLTNLFSPLPVRRKELERNIKREYGKALSLLTAYALLPCAAGSGVRLTVSNHLEKGTKTVQIQTLGTPSSRSSVTSLWGHKALDNIVDIDLNFEVEREMATIKRLKSQDSSPIAVKVKGLVSKFAVGCGRTGTDRQFFYVNGRPCNMPPIQKAFNEVYRSFNANQAPFIVADFIIPTDAYDVNVSPDKRTILIHHEGSLITELKAALEANFSAERSTYDVGSTRTQTQTLLTRDVLPLNASHSRQIFDENGTAAEERSLRSPQIELPQESSRVTGSSAPLNTPPRPSTQFAADPNDTEVNRLRGVDVPQESSWRQKSSDNSIVLDTSRAVWSRHPEDAARTIKSSQKEISDSQCHNGQAPPAERGPLKQKRKLDNDTDVHSQEVGDNTPTPVLPTSQRGTKDPIQSKSRTLEHSISLRNRLASFARPGSQPSLLRLVETTGNIDDNQSSEDDEEMIDELEEDNRADGNGTKSDQLKGANCADKSQSPGQPRLIARSAPGLVQSSLTSEGPISGQSELSDGDNDIIDSVSLLSQARASSATTPSTISLKDQVIHPEIIKTDKDGGDVSLRLDLDKIRQVWSLTRIPTALSSAETKKEGVPLDAGVSNTEDDEKAVLALSRVIEKKDFEDMTVVGQFNLGFIVVRRQKQKDVSDYMDDLFIVDQHAADEKYNFETLQATTKIESQRLFRPQDLELTAADEILAVENLDVLRQNGFEIDVDEDASIDRGSRLKLAAIPVSKSTVFDVKDLEEIVHLMRDRPAGKMVRCSKARAMFASRACRKSVMIGMPLTYQQMTTVIRHMGTTDQPWNCPHGRPTMRHLFDITASTLATRNKVDWSLF